MKATAGTTRARRASDYIKKKAAAPDKSAATETCRVIGCKRSVRAATTQGVGRTFCTYHLQRLRRHGHPTRPSLRASQAAPYRFAALAWIEENAHNPYVEAALKKVASRLKHSGRTVRAHETFGLPATEKVRGTWTRLATRNVSPSVILATALGVDAALAEEKDPPRGREYARVQIAKILHRLAGCSTQRHQRAGSAHVHCWSAEERTEGTFLRHLGKQGEALAALLVEHHLGDVLDTRRALEASGKKTWRKRPYPPAFANKASRVPVRIIEAPEPPNVRPRAVREVETAGGAKLTIIQN